MDLDLPIAKNSLLGTALGDSLGLPYEGLSPTRAQRLMPFPLRQRLLGRRGSTSDDTVQAGLVLLALVECKGDERLFSKKIAKSLRVWFLSIPPGIGLATIKACLRLCIGISPSQSGVNSAGNGAAMRAAVIGAALNRDPDSRKRFVAASTKVTHSHPDAETGAQLVALAAALNARSEMAKFSDEARRLAPDWNLDHNWTDKGPTGWVRQTVNAAVSICLEPNISLETGIEKAVALGGDTDTVAAIVGGILGSRENLKVEQQDWMNYVGYPSPSDIRSGNLKASYPRLLAQHMTVLPVVVAYGFRRLLPPY